MHYPYTCQFEKIDIKALKELSFMHDQLIGALNTSYRAMKLH